MASTTPLRSDVEAEAAPGVEDLEAALRPAWVDVDLEALEHNLATVRSHLEPGTRTMAVVKADAYGHGAVGVSRVLAAAGVDWLGVALLEEGAELRRAGIEVPILVLGPARPSKISLYRRYRLTPTVSSLAELALWRDWTAAVPRRPQPVHLKVNTGMGRLGVAMEEVPRALEILRGTSTLRLAGLLSHFGDADDLASPRNELQAGRFDEVLALLTEEERSRIEIHMANSAATLYRPRSRFTLVRLGIAVYGVDPAERPGEPPHPEAMDLKPVMSVKARIVQLREVPAGTPLSYGGRTVTRRRSRIAVVPVGYADGYAWRLTGKAEALVRGRRVPIAGSVTMDMTLLDVTETGAEPGEEVVLMGRQGDEEIPALELATHAGTISWEILCHLGLRLPRRYVRDGRVLELVSRFSREDG
jgi:alanine racemase